MRFLTSQWLFPVNITSTIRSKVTYVLSLSNTLCVLESILLDQYVEGVYENTIRSITNTYCEIGGFSISGKGIIYVIGI